MSSTPRPNAPTGAHGELPWWGYGEVHRRLSHLLGTLGGGRRFALLIKGGAGVSYTDFERRRVVVDPEIVADPDPAVHLVYLRGVIAHEAGHVRFTPPAYGMNTDDLGGSIKGQILAQVCNILEDERIDRAMANSHWGTEPYLRARKRALWEQRLTPLDPANEDPQQVLAAIIQLRYGWELKGSLSPTNAALLERCRPHVVAGWNAARTEDVVPEAKAIIAILGIDAQADAIEEQLAQMTCSSAMIEGRPDGADTNPNAGCAVRCDRDGEPGHSHAMRPSEPGGESSNASTGDADLQAARREAERDLRSVFGDAGSETEEQPPLPPRALSGADRAAAAARAAVLTRRLKSLPTRPRVRAVEDGPRYSLRDDLRTPERPMRKRDLPTRRRTVAIGALVDCSGSMSNAMPAVRGSMLAIEQSTREIGVPFALYGFSSWREPVARILEPGDRAGTTPERIAGLDATGGTVLAPALREASQALRRVRGVERRVLLVVHDGEPSDMEEAAIAARAAGRHCELIGIYIGDEHINPEAIERMSALFGRRLLIAPDPDALMPLVGGFIRRILSPAAA